MFRQLWPLVYGFSQVKKVRFSLEDDGYRVKLYYFNGSDEKVFVTKKQRVDLKIDFSYNDNATHGI